MYMNLGTKMAAHRLLRLGVGDHLNLAEAAQRLLAAHIADNGEDVPSVGDASRPRENSKRD